jgi:integrase
VRLGDIELDDINIWVKSLETDGELGALAPATAAKHLNLLSQCLAAAVKSGKLAANPAALANVPIIPDQEARFLTLDELVDLEDATAKHWKPVVAFMGDVGPRIGEVGALRVYDVDLLNLRVRIRETVVYEGGGRGLGPTKTAAGYRTVPFLSPEVAEQVSRFIRDNRRSGTDLLFVGPRGGPFDPRNFRERVFNPAVTAAELATPLPTPHALRHTAISRWIAGGTTDVKKLATAAGHKKVAVFFDRYGHLLPYDARPTIDALSQQKAEALERKRARGLVENVVPLDPARSGQGR